MITWDNAIQDCQDLAQDPSTGALTFFKRKLNKGYKKALAVFSRPYTELTKTTLTVASQQYYQLPPDFIRLHSITVTVGTTTYPLDEVESQNEWNMVNMYPYTQDIPTRFFIRPRAGYNGNEVGLYPTPSTANYTITIVYEATAKDLTQTKYVTGTITATLNSATVTGSGTSWTSAMIGRYFSVTDTDGNTDGMFYRVSAVGGTGSLTLENVYEGPTISGGTYQIAEVYGLPEDMHSIPTYYALWHYHVWKRNKDAASENKSLFVDLIKEARVTYGTKTTSGIIRHTPIRSARRYPPYFPQNIS